MAAAPSLGCGLLDEAEATLCIDTNRVYFAGLSNGAMMTSSIACELSGRVAAAGAVAGVADPDGCAFSRPVPLVAFHGTDDQFLAYTGGFGSWRLSEQVVALVTYDRGDGGGVVHLPLMTTDHRNRHA